MSEVSLVWKTLVEFFKGLFTGKGSTQIGSGNIAVSVGQDATNVNVAKAIHITQPQMPMPIPTFEPRPEEAEILTRLAASHTLHFVRVDSVAGFVVLIDGIPLADIGEPEACLRYIEAVQRLREHKLLINPRGDEEVFHLSADGRDVKKQLEASKRKCAECGRSMENVGADPTHPPVWECKNSRCLHSAWHRDAKCPKCGKPAAEITSGGVGFTMFLCQDGHPFMTSPSRK